MNPRITDLDREVGRLLRELRIDRHCSQSDAAAAVGMTSQQLGKVERGINRISIGRLIKYLQFLHVPIAGFFEQIGEHEWTNHVRHGHHVRRLVETLNELSPPMRAHVQAIIDALSARPEKEINGESQTEPQ